MRGDTKIEYKFPWSEDADADRQPNWLNIAFTAAPSKNADRLNPDGWNLADEDFQLGEVFWNGAPALVFHADADCDTLESSVLRAIADFMETIEWVARERHAATSGQVQ